MADNKDLDQPGSAVNASAATPKSAAAACQKCGAVGYSTSYYADCPEKKRMDRDGLCFTCAFWSLKADVLPHRRTIIDGRSYGPGNNTSGQFRGMGGRRFDIEYNDGRRITTFDLWSGGEIPSVWRDLLPDNARFMGEAEAVRVGDVTCWNASDTRKPAYPLPKDCQPRVGAPSASTMDADRDPGMGQ